MPASLIGKLAYWDLAPEQIDRPSSIYPGRQGEVDTGVKRLTEVESDK